MRLCGRPVLAPTPEADRLAPVERTFVLATAASGKPPGGTPSGPGCPLHGNGPTSGTMSEGRSFRPSTRHRFGYRFGCHPYAASWAVERRLHAGDLPIGKHDHRGVVDVIHIVHEHVAVGTVVAGHVRKSRPAVVR